MYLKLCSIYTNIVVFLPLQLLSRPAQLHLLPSETYPTERGVGERVDMSRVFVVGEMQQMAHFVYQDYSMRLEALRQQNEQVGLHTESW